MFVLALAAVTFDNLTPESNAGRGGPFLGRMAAHRSFGGGGDRLREVKPSSARHPASVRVTHRQSEAAISLALISRSLSASAAFVVEPSCEL